MVQETTISKYHSVDIIISSETILIIISLGYFDKIGPVFLVKKMKMLKVIRQTNERSDNGQEVIKKSHFSF